MKAALLLGLVFHSALALPPVDILAAEAPTATQTRYMLQRQWLSLLGGFASTSLGAEAESAVGLLNQVALEMSKRVGGSYGEAWHFTQTHPAQYDSWPTFPVNGGAGPSETFLVWACPGSGEGVVPTNKVAAMRLHKHCAWVNHCLSMWRQGQPMPDADDGAL